MRDLRIPPLREEQRPPESHVEWNDPLERKSEQSYIEEAAKEAGKTVSDLTEGELEILRSSWRGHESYRTEWSAPLDPFGRQDYSRPIAEPV